eukprot:TRINITY_DN3035_c0_g1_i3.p1 TRINITY_DN3035_c0_g1~~TRINITY_DN3035_c0_g1_i3.p1  ORF type:complete len:326 (+),score=84.89 TRINITY_DN3035_c0_g1_i3:62-1039(+)
MACFVSSSHKERWVFPVDELFSQIEDVLEQFKSIYGKNLDPTNPDLVPFNVQEETHMKLQFERYVELIGRKMKWHIRMITTALMYFKRFYLYRSIMEYPPKRVALGCLFLAGKIEACPWTGSAHGLINQIVLVSKVAEEEIVEMELVILAGIKFDLFIYSPHRPLDGLLSILIDKGFATLEEANQWQAKANSLMSPILLTVLPLCHTPAQVALHCLVKSIEPEKVDGALEVIDEFVKSSTALSSNSKTKDLSSGLKSGTLSIKEQHEEIRHSLHYAHQNAPPLGKDKEKSLKRRLRQIQKHVQQVDDELNPKRVVSDVTSTTVCI